MFPMLKGRIQTGIRVYIRRHKTHVYKQQKQVCIALLHICLKIVYYLGIFYLIN